MLLHNGNRYGAVPVGHSTVLKEQQNDIGAVMDLLKYHGWIICVHLKVVSFLLGQQKGYTKFPCFLCMWDSRDRESHWTRKEWPKYDILKAVIPNTIYDTIVSRDKIILPPFRIKLA